MHITVEQLPEVLKIAGFGMLGIFIVTGVIILMVTGLNRLTAKEKKE